MRQKYNPLVWYSMLFRFLFLLKHYPLFMKIRLVRTGGIIPVTKQSETDVNWTETDVQQLKIAAQTLFSSTDKTRDGVYYHIQSETETFAIDWPKIPSKYRNILEKLKDRLVIVKPS